MGRGTLFSFLLLASFAAHAQETISVSAVGDLMMGTTYPTNMLPSDQGKNFFPQVAPYLKSTDINFANCEGTFFDGGPQADGKAPGEHRFLFKTPIDYVARLTEAGFNVVSLANNHSHDFGQEGFVSTQQTLQLAGIQESSKNGEVARFNIRGVKVALIAVDFYPGRRSITTPQSVFKEIQALKQNFDIVIVSGHVGAEGLAAEHVPQGEETYLGENRGDSLSFAHGAIDHGADLILFQGPHVPRAMEIYKNRLISYSLGNFATGMGINTSGAAGDSPLLQVQLAQDGQFIQGRIVSFVQKESRYLLLDPQQKAFHLIENLSQSDFAQSSPNFKADGTF